MAQSGGGLSVLGSIGEFLSHGGLGLMALACVIVLGYNTRSLNELVRDSDDKKVTAAAPLLRWNMAISAAGLLLFTVVGLYLVAGERSALILLDPSATSDPLFKELQLIKVDGKPVNDHPISVPCKNSAGTNVIVDFRRYMAERDAKAIKAQAVLPDPTEALGLDR